MDFNKLAKAVEQQFSLMSKSDLYRVNIDKNELYEFYLDAFPEGTNPIFKERREYDCNCCKNFIRDAGNAVSIKNGKLVTIWDITIADETFQIVANAMAAKIRKSTIADIFTTHEAKLGAVTTKVFAPEAGAITSWNHFYATVPAKFVGVDGATIGKARTSKNVFIRGAKEITTEAVDDVLDLMASNAIYRGAEFQAQVIAFKELQDGYKAARNKSIYAWLNYKSPGAYIRNSAIGTLLVDLSEGVSITDAVKSFETKVAPANYKRPTALITQGMINKAMETIDELGIEASLHRRFAQISDISINNVLFADRGVSSAMKDGLAGMLAPTKVAKLDTTKVEDISIEDFITNIIPKIDSLELMVENRLSSNLVSLIAPIHADSPNILKWDNNFTWSYAGNVTDSMKERVKSAGGKVDGDLRFSIQWNEDNQDTGNDLDAHCTSPKSHIYYSNKNGGCGGNLDVDITYPGSKIAVENITWDNVSNMPDGTYDFYVNNYSGRNTSGFTAEVEMLGEIFTYSNPRSVTSDIRVATVVLKNGKFTIKHVIAPGSSSRETWNLKTEQFQKVNIMTISPNHWDNNKVGNKHYFFMLDNCTTEEQPRGFYNEFLKGSLEEHRKVLEVLGSKTKCEMVSDQLSGVGFSSTKRDSVICRVRGDFSRTLKINF